MIFKGRSTEAARILLAVAWSTEDMRQMFERYPEVMGADVTSQTNKENRPLFILAGKTADNETFTALAAFLPRQSRWVFDWLFRVAVPLLLPQDALDRVRLLMTDGDEKEYNPFVQVAEEFYPQAMHGLCVWHIINRGWKDNGITASGPEKDGPGPLILKAAKNWPFSWSRDVETDEEFNFSFRFFLAWMDKPEITSALTHAKVAKIKKFIIVSMLPLRGKWVRNAARNHCRCFGVRTTNHVEAENSVLKCHSLGTKPCHPLQKSVKVQLQLGASRFQTKRVNAASALTKTPTGRCIPGVHDTLTAYGAKLAVSEFDARTFYKVIKIS
mmetsp:Transcript_20602/g.50787  ORF Transcript_20602/g.50787 Transcript_20602/m.50787 type:complete len:328 (-) Transcript_20602:989-1972(-)